MERAPLTLRCILYTKNITERLQYIVGILFTKDLVLTHSTEQFIAFDGYKINYSDSPICTNEYWVIPQGLLAETTIQLQSIDCFKWEGLPAFFKTTTSAFKTSSSAISFDFLSAAFYLITRYEEYLPFVPDEMGRFNHATSLAYQQNFLHQPLIQLWMKKLEQLYGIPCFYWPAFTFTPSYDIDIAYSYLHHSMVKNIGGFFKDFIKADIHALGERMQVLNGVVKDPYDVYDWLHLLHSSLHLKPIYFFLMAKNRKGVDKNIAPNCVAMMQLIKDHAHQYTIGIHPSVQSTISKTLLQAEINQLQKASNTLVTIARQHYIQLRFPSTYMQLDAAGIQQDFSMGYPSMNGFRASYAASHAWFNLSTNSPTKLKIHPFFYMDATAIFNERITANQGLSNMQYYFNAVKEVGGNCIFIFHNHFLTQQVAFKEWRNSYADFLLSNFTK